MAIEEMREVQTPLDGDTGDDTATTDTGDDGADGGDSGGGEDTQPSRPIAARGKDGKFNKPPREQKRGEYRDRSQLTAKLTGVETQVAALARQNEQYQRDIAELRQAAMRGQQRPAESQPAAASPLDQRIKTLKQAIDSEVAAFRNHDPAKGAYDPSKYEKLKEEYDEARVEAGVLKAMRAVGVDPSQRGRQQPQMTREEVAQTAADVARRDTIFSENKWLVTPPSGIERPKIMKAFTQTIEYLVNVEGREAFSINTDREAAAIVARKYRIPTQQAAPRAARMPLTDNHRGGGDEGERGTFEVPSAQLDGVSPEVARRVASRLARERR